MEEVIRRLSGVLNAVSWDRLWTINMMHQGASRKNICHVDLVINFIISKFENRQV